MTLRDFNQLSLVAKTEVVDLWGDLLKEKVVPGHKVKVYQVDNFYVEVFYDSYGREVKRYRACIEKDTVCSVL
jgi:hypothetical protein